MSIRTVSVLGAMAIFGAPASEAVQLSGRGFLSLSSKMQPDAVAATLVKVDGEWTSMAMNFASCNATMSETGADCSEPEKSFAESCSKIVSAMVQASAGQRGVVKEYMNDVCSQKVLEGYRQEHCQTLAQSMLESMTVDSYDNRQNLDAVALCGNYWSHFTASEEARAAREQAEREAAEKKAEEQKVEEEAQEEAARKAADEEAAKKAAEEETAAKKAAEEVAAEEAAAEEAAKAHEETAAAAQANAAQVNSTAVNSTAVNATVGLAASDVMELNSTISDDQSNESMPLTTTAAVDTTTASMPLTTTAAVDTASMPLTTTAAVDTTTASDQADTTEMSSMVVKNNSTGVVNATVA